MNKWKEFLGQHAMLPLMVVDTIRVALFIGAWCGAIGAGGCTRNEPPLSTEARASHVVGAGWAGGMLLYHFGGVQRVPARGREQRLRGDVAAVFETASGNMLYMTHGESHSEMHLPCPTGKCPGAAFILWYRAASGRWFEVAPPEGTPLEYANRYEPRELLALVRDADGAKRVFSTSGPVTPSTHESANPPAPGSEPGFEAPI